jgi:hypothetical protein
LRPRSASGGFGSASGVSVCLRLPQKAGDQRGIDVCRCLGLGILAILVLFGSVIVVVAGCLAGNRQGLPLAGKSSAGFAVSRSGMRRDHRSHCERRTPGVDPERPEMPDCLHSRRSRTVRHRCLHARPSQN